MIDKWQVYVLQFAIVALAVYAGWLRWDNSSLTDALTLERSQHNATRLERDTAVKDGLGWMRLYTNSTVKMGALQGQSAECLRREEQAQTDAAARAAIMQKAQPTQRTTTDQVVDDATRKAAADYLNRPWP